MWNFIVGYASGDAVNFHLIVTCGICLLKTKFSLARGEMKVFLKIVILNKTNNDCIFL